MSPISTMDVVAPITIAVALVFAHLWKHACSDWRYQVRLAIAMSRLEARESPITALLLEEVRLDLPTKQSELDEPLDNAARRDELPHVRFHVANSTEEQLGLCDRWYLDSTPLLLAQDERGAVLCGPGGAILGAIEHRESEVHSGWDWDLCQR